MSRTLTFSLVFWFAALISMSAHAGAGADARSQLESFAEGLESLAGEFRQVIRDPDGFVVEESSGSMKFLAPDRFRWDYVEPFPQQLVADGARLWHFDEALDQVTVRDQPPAAESPLLVLTRPDLLDHFYRVEPSTRVDELVFAPLESDGDFERATLQFRDGVPVALELIDRLVGQTTYLELIDLQRNPGLGDGDFVFEPPPGVDILEGY